MIITWELPLAEILMDFFDTLKSRTRGYASFDYDFLGYREASWSSSTSRSTANRSTPQFHYAQGPRLRRGRALAARLKEVVPRQLFEIRIQAAIGARVIAAETVSAMRKNVIAKCYGGDITRKRNCSKSRRKASGG